MNDTLPGAGPVDLGLGADATTAPMGDLGRACVLIVSPTVLAELLQLPAGSQIDAAASPHDQPGVLHLRVRGAGWPTREGMLLPHVRGSITRQYTAEGRELMPVVTWPIPDAPNAELS